MPRKGPLCADCGKRMWGGPGVLPEGQARCQPCRRLRPTVSSTPRFVPAELACVCGEVFTQSRWGQRYCIPEHSPSHERNKMKTERGGRSGHAWRKLRTQVIS